MDILGTLVGSAKQLAQNAIFDKLDSKAGGADHPLLNVLRDAFEELSPADRKKLFEAFSQLYTTYQAQETFDFESLWKEITNQQIIQDIAVKTSKKLVSNVIRADKDREQ